MFFECPSHKKLTMQKVKKGDGLSFYFLGFLFQSRTNEPPRCDFPGFESLFHLRGKLLFYVRCFFDVPVTKSSRCKKGKKRDGLSFYFLGFLFQSRTNEPPRCGFLGSESLFHLRGKLLFYVRCFLYALFTKKVPGDKIVY